MVLPVCFFATNLHAWFSPFHIPAHSPVSYDDDFTRDERIAHPVFSLHRNFLWDLALSKLYTNSLLSTLNARAGWNNLAGQGSTNLLFTEASGDAPRARKQARFRCFSHLLILTPLQNESHPNNSMMVGDFPASSWAPFQSSTLVSIASAWHDHFGTGRTETIRGSRQASP